MNEVREFAEKFGHMPSAYELAYYLDCTIAYAQQLIENSGKIPQFS